MRRRQSARRRQPARRRQSALPDALGLAASSMRQVGPMTLNAATIAPSVATSGAAEALTSGPRDERVGQ